MKRGMIGAVIVATLLLLATAVWAAEGVLLDEVDFGSAGNDSDYITSGWGRSVTDETGGSYGGIGSGGCRLIWDGAEDGPDAIVVLEPAPGALKSLVIRHLDGIADDGIAVSMQKPNGMWVLVGTYVDQGSAEQWIETDLDLSGYDFGRGRGAIPVKFEATGEKWANFDTYGQVCIDWVEAWGDGKP